VEHLQHPSGDPARPVPAGWQDTWWGGLAYVVVMLTLFSLIGLWLHGS
jgi:hypothetical protein